MPHRIVSHSGTSSVSPGATSLPSRPIAVPPSTAQSRAESMGQIMPSAGFRAEGPGPRSGPEADLAGGAVPELDVRQLGDGHDQATALDVLQRQDAVVGDGVRDLLLDRLRGVVDIDRELTRGVLDADLDLHEVLLRLGRARRDVSARRSVLIGQCWSVSA